MIFESKVMYCEYYGLKEKPASLKLPVFYLSGMSSSEGEYLALINDKMVTVGDFWTIPR